MNNRVHDNNDIIPKLLLAKKIVQRNSIRADSSDCLLSHGDVEPTTHFFLLHMLSKENDNCIGFRSCLALKEYLPCVQWSEFDFY